MFLRFAGWVFVPDFGSGFGGVVPRFSVSIAVGFGVGVARSFYRSEIGISTSSVGRGFGWVGGSVERQVSRGGSGARS